MHMLSKGCCLVMLVLGFFAETPAHGKWQGPAPEPMVMVHRLNSKFNMDAIGVAAGKIAITRECETVLPANKLLLGTMDSASGIVLNMVPTFSYWTWAQGCLDGYLTKRLFVSEAELTTFLGEDVLAYIAASGKTLKEILWKNLGTPLQTKLSLQILDQVIGLDVLRDFKRDPDLIAADKMVARLQKIDQGSLSLQQAIQHLASISFAMDEYLLE